MANRPIFIPNYQKISNNDITIDNLVQIKNIDFTWYSGLSIADKQKSITSLHENAKKTDGINNILEISTRSTERIGVALSAFNLKIKTTKNNEISVESIYQSSKVFRGNIQYLDLLYKSPAEAKKDERLKSSGEIIAFRPFGKQEKEWNINPISAFYNWIYINALMQHPEYHQQLLKYQAFTDIEFNPKKSLNCQAYATALFCSLYKNDVLDDVMQTPQSFLTLYNVVTDKETSRQQQQCLDLF